MFVSDIFSFAGVCVCVCAGISLCVSVVLWPHRKLLSSPEGQQANKQLRGRVDESSGRDSASDGITLSLCLSPAQISEPPVVAEGVRGQYEGLRLQLHLHAGLLREDRHRPVSAGVLRAGGHVFQPHHALRQPRVPAHGGEVLESPQRARQTPVHGALPGQLGLGAVRGSDGLRLLAVSRGPGRAAGQPPLLRQHPALHVVPRHARGVRPALAAAQKRHVAHETGTLPPTGRRRLELPGNEWSQSGPVGVERAETFEQSGRHGRAYWGTSTLHLGAMRAPAVPPANPSLPWECPPPRPAASGRGHTHTCSQRHTHTHTLPDLNMWPCVCLCEASAGTENVWGRLGGGCIFISFFSFYADDSIWLI